jgi:uncharacterized membrane protein YphA (DoxX/SURF4 family)/thiol-disulfide isomerase/thioredoxin
MSSAPLAALLIVLTLAAVLLVSGFAKLRDPRATRDAFDALRVPRVVPSGAAAAALPWLEVGLAVLLLVAPPGWLVPVSLTLLLLMLAYTALVARALSFDEPVTCSCFGTLGRHEVDRTTLARNVLLIALAGLTFWFAMDGGSVKDAVGDLDAGDGWALLAAAVAAVVAVLVTGGGSSVEHVPDAELLDYDRSPVPYGVLSLSEGRTSTLAELAATQAKLLVVLSPGCSPCSRTAEKLDAWAARLAPVVGVLAIYPDEPTAEAVTEHAAELSAWEPELNVRRVFSVGTPAAILLGADGFLAGGPVAGENKVARFVEDVLAELSEQPFPVE